MLSVEYTYPYESTAFVHAVQEISIEGSTSSVSEQEQFRLPDHKQTGFGNDNGQCFGNQITEASTIA